MYDLMDTGEDINNPFLNVAIAASVTAYSQVKLMEKMFEVGPENVIYCDTDSVPYLKKIEDPLGDSPGLGNWEDEFPNRVIEKFVSIAPKCYVVKMQDKKDKMKCKGVTPNEPNRELLNYETFVKLVKNAFEDEEEEEKVRVGTFNIFANSTSTILPYGTLCSRFSNKDVRVVYSKRNLVKSVNGQKLEDMSFVRLVPKGYEGSVGNF